MAHRFQNTDSRGYLTFQRTFFDFTREALTTGMHWELRAEISVMNHGVPQHMTYLWEHDPPPNIVVLVGSNYALVFNVDAVQLIRDEVGVFRHHYPGSPPTSESGDAEISDEAFVLGDQAMPEEQLQD